MHMDRRPVIIGLVNPHSDDPANALAPYPRGCSGWRLWQLLADRLPDVTEEQYLAAFDRRNLLPRGVAAKHARSYGMDVLMEMWQDQSDLSGRTVLVLGTSVRNALDLEPYLIHPMDKWGVTWRQLPHPSGLCRWYNHPTNRLLASLLLEDLYTMGRET